MSLDRSRNDADRGTSKYEYTVSEKDCTFFFFFFLSFFFLLFFLPLLLGAHCVESGVSCTDCY